MGDDGGTFKWALIALAVGLAVGYMFGTGTIEPDMVTNTLENLLPQ